MPITDATRRAAAEARARKKAEKDAAAAVLDADALKPPPDSTEPQRATSAPDRAGTSIKRDIAILVGALNAGVVIAGGFAPQLRDDALTDSEIPLVIDALDAWQQTFPPARRWLTLLARQGGWAGLVIISGIILTPRLIAHGVIPASVGAKFSEWLAQLGVHPGGPIPVPPDEYWMRQQGPNAPAQPPQAQQAPYPPMPGQNGSGPTMYAGAGLVPGVYAPSNGGGGGAGA